MTKKANILAAASFIVGVAGFQFYAYQLKRNVEGGAPVAVLLVTQDLSPGTILSEENLKTTEIPSDYLDARRIPATEKGTLLGVSLQNRLRAGDGLVWSDLADGAAHRHLASLIVPGKRAYSLSSSANPLGRLLKVGDHVDVLLEAGGKSSLLLERVLVLAVGGDTKAPGVTELASAGLPNFNWMTPKKGVTLSLSAEESQTIFAAEARGELRLVLRNPEDHRKEEVVEVVAGKGKKHARRKAVAADETLNAGARIEHVR